MQQFRFLTDKFGQLKPIGVIIAFHYNVALFEIFSPLTLCWLGPSELSDERTLLIVKSNSIYISLTLKKHATFTAYLTVKMFDFFDLKHSLESRATTNPINLNRVWISSPRILVFLECASLFSLLLFSFQLFI